jgi:hypothetical protein
MTLIAGVYCSLPACICFTTRDNTFAFGVSTACTCQFGP